ncbi:MAG: PAS domain S-box protein, partial [Acidimicrobiia bacterium]|nr:PAS domain S-box protein [Acidimicrobiia bacterium]
MSAKNHLVLPGLAFAVVLATLPFGRIGSLLAYVCVAGLVAYACLRLTTGTGYRFLAGAATTFALAQVARYLGMDGLFDMIAIVGYLQVAAVGLFLFRRRVRRLDGSTLLEAGAVASVGAMYVLLASRTVSSQSAGWVIPALTTACAVLLFATLMGRERNKHITAMSVAIAAAVILELLAASVPAEHYDRIWALVYLPVLYAVGLPAEDRQLKLAPIPARRAFGPLQQILFSALLIAPLMAIGIGAIALPSDQVVDLAAIAVVTAILLTFRFQLLIRQRDWSYAQERRLRTFSDTIISSGDPEKLDSLTLETLHRLIDGDGIAALAEADGDGLVVNNIKGLLKPEVGRYRAIDFGDDVPQADSWFESQGRCAARIRVAVPLTGDHGRSAMFFLAAASRPINADIESHFRAAAAQYSLAVRANMLDAQIQEERANSRFATMSQDINDVVFLVDPSNHRIMLGSSTVERILGFETAASVGADVIDYVVAEDRGILRHHLSNPVGATWSPTNVQRPDVRLIAASGESRWFEVQVRDLAETGTEGLLVSFSDVHDRKMAGLNLQNSEARFRALVQNSLEVSMLVKDDLTMTYVSPNVGGVFDFTSEHLVGSSLLGFVHPSSEIQLNNLLESCQAGSKPVRGEISIRSTKGGPARLAEVTITRSDVVGPDTYVMVFRDITARRELEESLLQKSVTDEVTGTLNRSAFVYQTQVALRSAGDDEQVAVIMIELANFSAITNNVGFDGGDQVLAILADKLRGALRPGDVLSRPSGAEFAICTTVDDTSSGAQLAERLRNLVAEPIEVAAHMHNPRPAVGIAVNDQSRDPNGLLQKAIVAVNRSRD